ncbi:MAG: hypothetical protein CSA20_02520 [Deltaproteobacteria bacterium]|nr:MAG: hypothetical protein CSA20_02520 [Deltaproteobacteria bacterium]
MIMQAPFFATPSLSPVQSASPAPFGTPGEVVTTLTLASAVSIGSNMIEVQRGTMPLSRAVFNGVAKGAAAALIVQTISRSSVLQVALAASVLASAGYVIDTIMKPQPAAAPQTAE